MDSPAAPLPALPELVLPAGTQLARVHPVGATPWNLSSHEDGRFNLDSPAGTCYLAPDPLCAFVETFGRGRTVDPNRLAKYRLSLIELEDEWRLADLMARAARGAGITAEISSTSHYEITREWARAIHQAGYDGVRYRPRNDPSSTLESIGLFSEAGGKQGRVIRTETLPAGLVDQAISEFELVVAERRFPLAGS